MVFGVFSVAPGHPAEIRPTRRTPQGGIQGSFLPLEEPRGTREQGLAGSGVGFIGNWNHVPRVPFRRGHFRG